MALFGGATKTQIGIDIGTSSIKMAEMRLEKAGKGSLINYAIADFQQSDDISVRNWDPNQIGEMVGKLISQSKIKSKKAGISVGIDESFTTYLRLPVVDQKDMDNAIAYEVKKYIPMNLSDVKLGSEVLKRDAQTNQIHVLVVAVPNTVIAKYRQVARLNSLELITLEVETFSLVRTFLASVTGVTLVIDIGALKTSLSIIKDEHAMLNSSLEMGGANFTKALSQGLNVSSNRAEVMKVQQGMQGQAQEVVRSQADRFISEIQNIVGGFERDYGEKINQLLLLGSTSQMAGLKEYIIQSLGGIKLFQPNPFQNVNPPAKVSENILLGLGMRLSIAMGIALKPED